MPDVGLLDLALKLLDGLEVGVLLLGDRAEDSREARIRRANDFRKTCDDLNASLFRRRGEQTPFPGRELSQG